MLKSLLNNQRPRLVLAAIILLAAFLRLYALESIPSGFHRDEVANAYLGRFVIENSRDIYGNVWPIFAIDKKGDFPPSIPMYMSGMTTKIFGETIFATRLPFALFGILTVALTYVCANLIFGERRYLSYLATLVSATMPWQVAFSRIQAEGVLAGMVFMLGLVFFLRFLREQKPHLIILSFIFWIATYLLYPSYRVTIPLIYILLTLLQLFGGKKSRRNAIIFAVCSVLAVVMTYAVSQSPWGAGRFNQTSWVSAYANGGNPMEEYVMQDKNIVTARVMNSKPIYYLQAFAREYLSYFSPEFLITGGAKPIWFALPRVGLLQLTAFLLMLVAFAKLSNIVKDKSTSQANLPLLIMIVVSPVASAFTSEHTPNTHRAYLMSLLLPLFASYALLGFDSIKKSAKNLILILLITGFAVESIWLGYNMFTQWSMHSAVYRDDGLLQAARVASATHDNYESVYMFNSGWFPIYYLFASKNYDPQLIGKFPGEFQISNVGNVHFLRTECPDALWQKEFCPKGSVALFVQKDCKLDNFAKTPKFIRNIPGNDERFASLALYEIKN